MIFVLLLALGIVKLLDVVKEATASRVYWPPWAKGLAAIALGVGISLALGEPWIHGLAAAGLAGLLHEVQALLNMAVNERVQSAVQRLRRRG